MYNSAKMLKILSKKFFMITILYSYFMVKYIYRKKKKIIIYVKH